MDRGKGSQARRVWVLPEARSGCAHLVSVFGQYLLEFTFSATIEGVLIWDLMEKFI